MNSIRKFVTCLLLSLMTVNLLGISPLDASNKFPHGLMVKGTLVHKNGTPVTNKTIYFFAVFPIKDNKELSAKTSFKEGRIANPSAVTNDEGLFEINITSDFLKETGSKQFSVGLLSGFGPGFTILRTQEGIAEPINIDPNKIEGAKSPVKINVGRIILDQ